MPTTKTTVNESYSLLAAGPMMIEVKGEGAARIHFGSVAPGDGTDAYHDLVGPGNIRSNRQVGPSHGVITFSGTLNVYVRAEKGSADVFWSTET